MACFSMVAVHSQRYFPFDETKLMLTLDKDASIKCDDP